MQCKSFTLTPTYYLHDHFIGKASVVLVTRGRDTYSATTEMTAKISDRCGQVSFLTRAMTIGILAILLGCNYRRFINITVLTSSILQQMQTWDFGNAIAALVAVGGYMAEHFFSRKQVRAQIDKILCVQTILLCKICVAHETNPKQSNDQLSIIVVRRNWRNEWSE
jgi:hypothetical protein